MKADELIARVTFNGAGLVPVIAQCHNTQQVLMMAWMNAEAIQKTLETQQVYYWSRSRNALWRKGETSGNTQKLLGLHIDCDGDTLLATIEQTGPACHTGERSCFFTKVT